MASNPSVVVFSSFDAIEVIAGRPLSSAVGEAVDRLRDDDVPLVFHSTKTRAQIERLHQEMEIRHPFIVENGSAVFIPAGCFAMDIPKARHVAEYQVVEFGRPYAEVVDLLHRAANRVGVRVVGFNDMSVEEVAIDCRLSLLEARLAKLREYEEPFRILGSAAGARHRLARALRAENLGCTRHGRYEHAGAVRACGAGVALLCALYRCTGRSPITIGFGTGMNDADWLHLMDIPLIVNGVEIEDAAVSQRLLTQVPRARVTTRQGVFGWVGSLIATLDALRSKSGLNSST